MLTVGGILTFVSKKNFMLSLVEHGKSFMTSGPDIGETFGKNRANLS